VCAVPMHRGLCHSDAVPLCATLMLAEVAFEYYTRAAYRAGHSKGGKV